MNSSIPIEIEEEPTDIGINSGNNNSAHTHSHCDTHNNTANFPMTQSAPETSALIEQAQISRRVFLYLIEKYNLAPSVILHSLYLHSGSVSACEAYLSDFKIPAAWTLSEDQIILTDSDCSEIIERKGLGALNERRTFLHQVCYEAVGSCSEISSKLK